MSPCLTGGTQLTLVARGWFAAERRNRGVVVVRKTAVVIKVALRRGPMSVHWAVNAWVVTRD